MNWYGDNSYLNGITDKDKKNEIINDLTWDDAKSSGRVLDIAGKNNIYYYAVEVFNKEANETFIKGGVVLTSMQNQVLMKNIIEEFHGPMHYDCPSRILDILTPTDNNYANSWRKKCGEYQAHKSYVGEMRRLCDKDPDALFFVKNSYTASYKNGSVFKTIAPDAVACGQLWYNKTTVFRAKDVKKIFSLTFLEKQFYESLQKLTTATPMVAIQANDSLKIVVSQPDVNQTHLGNILASYSNLFEIIDDKVFTPDVVKGVLEMNNSLIDKIPSKNVFDLTNEIVSAYNSRPKVNEETQKLNYRTL